MNNEANNNVNNTENASGVNFVHVGAQNGSVGTSPMPNQSAQQIPQTVVNQGIPVTNTPQVEPQPVTPDSVSFVSVGASNPLPNPVQPGTVPTQATIPTPVQPIQNGMPPVTPPPVMPQQPIGQPLSGGMSPQMPGAPVQPGINESVKEEKVRQRIPNVILCRFLFWF